MSFTVENIKRQERREHYVEKIKALLTERKSASSKTIAGELLLNPNTLSSYIRHMHRDLRIIRPVWERKPFGACEWELGADANLPPEEPEKTQRVVPARQIGVARHWMDVALFGPAGVEVAA